MTAPVEPKRPPEALARRAVEAFLREKIGAIPRYSIAEDGESGWSFWVLTDDTTSYVHDDLQIEWHGTEWEPAPVEPKFAIDGACPECDGTGRDGNSSAPCPACLRPAPVEPMTAEEHLRRVWCEMRNNADPAATLAARAAAHALCAVGSLSADLRELWIRRFETCPGHDDEGGRDWCAYCGNMRARERKP